MGTDTLYKSLSSPVTAGKLTFTCAPLSPGHIASRQQSEAPVCKL